MYFRGTKQDYDMELPVMQIVQVTKNSIFVNFLDPLPTDDLDQGVL